VFFKPTVPEPPPACVDKGKAVIGVDVPIVAEPTQKPPTMKGPPICYHYGLSGHIQPKCPLLKAQRSKVKKELPRQKKKRSQKKNMVIKKKVNLL
jgi:hypothetical protein